ncbi:MAG: hypothetical protein IJC59_02310 [Lachnospiraceae bacterium]|nr:hypothetical protein [Lachnospiraceae bacterium]
MDKQEAVGRLEKEGYRVQFDSSVVTVLLPGCSHTAQEQKKLKDFLKEIGYHASFGIRHTGEEGNAAAAEKEEVPEELPEELQFGEQFSLEDFGIGQ